MQTGLQPHEGSSETVLTAPYNHLALLQPHEGSSETSSPEDCARTSSKLQPHEGSSETPRCGRPRGGGAMLQPHEGSSETRELVPQTARGIAASTPRGFV